MRWVEKVCFSLQEEGDLLLKENYIVTILLVISETDPHTLNIYNIQRKRSHYTHSLLLGLSLIISRRTV